MTESIAMPLTPVLAAMHGEAEVLQSPNRPGRGPQSRQGQRSGQMHCHVIESSSSSSSGNSICSTTATCSVSHLYAHFCVNCWSVVRSELRAVRRVQATQRAGRAGRTRPGKCYRLYSRQYAFALACRPILDSNAGTVGSVRQLDTSKPGWICNTLSHRMLCADSRKLLSC